jgi:tetratricopeptide (TPR) repeat protein
MDRGLAFDRPPAPAHWRSSGLMILLAALTAARVLAETVVPAEGLAAEGEKRWADAVAIYRTAISNDPQRVDLWLRIADVEATQDHNIVAAEATAMAAALKPDDAATWARLSQAWAVANKPTQALEANEHAVQLDPANVEYLSARAQLANWLGLSPVAAESCRRILELNPDDEIALLALARARSWTGELDDSVRAYRKYIKMKPDQLMPILELARVESWRGNFPEASKLIDRAAQQGADETSVQREKAKILAAADRPRAAMELIEPLLKEYPSDFEVHYAALVARHYGLRPAEARKEFDILKALRPDSKDTAAAESLVTTPQRHVVEGAVRYYEDTDHLTTTTVTGRGDLRLNDRTRVNGAIKVDTLSARKGSGLEQEDGETDARYESARIGANWIATPSLYARATMGAATFEGDTMPVFNAALDARPADSFSLHGEVDRDAYAISPRALSLAVKRTLGKLSAQYAPGLRWTVTGGGAYGELSDGNEYWECALAPRRTVLRSEWLNLDLGVRGTGFGYTDDLNNGYYDPEVYQQYSGTALGYTKLSANSGLGFLAAAGWYKDNTMGQFDFGWSTDVDLTVGARSDWLMKLSGGYFENFRTAASSGTGSYHALVASLSLGRRF